MAPSTAREISAVCTDLALTATIWGRAVPAYPYKYGIGGVGSTESPKARAIRSMEDQSVR